MGISLVEDQLTNSEVNWHIRAYCKWYCTTRGVGELARRIRSARIDAETLNKSFAFLNGKSLFITSLLALKED